MAIFTIGHSTHSEEEFIELLGEISTVVDIRSHPASKWAQFRRENLERWLPAAGKRYIWMRGLGGWRSGYGEQREALARRGVDPAMRRETGDESGWKNAGLRDYAYFQTTDEFRDAVAELIAMGEKEDVAIMCAEARWWKCHRSMVSDYLLFHGIDSTHIMRPGSAPSARKSHRDVIGSRLDRYPREVLADWERRRKDPSSPLPPTPSLSES